MFRCVMLDILRSLRIGEKFIGSRGSTNFHRLSELHSLSADLHYVGSLTAYH